MRQSGLVCAPFWMIQTFSRHEIWQGDQKKTGLFKKIIRFSFVFLRFLQKIKDCQKMHVFLIIG